MTLAVITLLASVILVNEHLVGEDRDACRRDEYANVSYWCENSAMTIVARVVYRTESDLGFAVFRRPIADCLRVRFEVGNELVTESNTTRAYHLRTDLPGRVSHTTRVTRAMSRISRRSITRHSRRDISPWQASLAYVRLAVSRRARLIRCRWGWGRDGVRLGKAGVHNVAVDGRERQIRPG